jgi:hypothetical protein
MVIVKIHKNKRNNQLIIAIPKKAYPFLHEEQPKTVNLQLKRKDFKF